MTVEHVHVHQEDRPLSEISQPRVDRGEGLHTKSPRNPVRAPEAPSPFLGAVLPPMRGTDPERETVPRPGDVEQPLQDARWKQHRT